MESFRLKNIIILILALLNLFLLGSLYNRASTQQAVREQLSQQLMDLFSADSARITLSEDAISFQTPPSGGTLIRDVEQDRQVAALLLGKGLFRSDQGGGIYSYEGSRGAAVFRSGGNFDATISLADGLDPEDLFRDFCKEFHYEPLTVQTDDAGFSAAAVRTFNKCRVTNCTVTFTATADTLQVSGIYLPETLSSVDREEPLSGPSALTAFLSARRESGAVVSAVTDLSPCYELQSTAAAPMTLIPAWCVETNAGSYYVNCYTGAVTHG